MVDEILRHPQYPELPCVTAVRLVSGYVVHLTFADGLEKDVDLEPYLSGPIFEPVRNNPEMFASMFIDGDTIAWKNGADIDPDTLYYDGAPPWAEEIAQAVAK